jgi:hypothetical protein
VVDHRRLPLDQSPTARDRSLLAWFHRPRWRNRRRRSKESTVSGVVTRCRSVKRARPRASPFHFDSLPPRFDQGIDHSQLWTRGLHPVDRSPAVRDRCFQARSARSALGNQPLPTLSAAFHCLNRRFVPEDRRKLGREDSRASCSAHFDTRTRCAQVDHGRALNVCDCRNRKAAQRCSFKAPTVSAHGIPHLPQRPFEGDNGQ